MDKDTRKALETTWTGNLIEITLLPDVNAGEKTFEKASCIFLVTGGDIGKSEIQLEAFGKSAEYLKKCSNGDHVRVTFIPSSRYFSQSDRWFTKLELQRIDIIDSGTQPQQTPADIYPAGNQLPTTSTTTGVAESDFDFSQG